MVKLSAFPPEVLNQILGTYSSSWLVIPLWLCGDSVLRRNIASGLTYVHLRGLGTVASFPFPRLLLQLRALRHLAIECHEFRINSPIDWLNIFDNLSGLLQTLIILSSNPCPFLNVSRDPLQVNSIETQFKRGSSRWIDLECRFPNLTRLGVRNIHCDDLAGLPSSLTSFAGPITMPYETPGGAYAAALPPSLKFIEGEVRVQNSSSNIDQICDDWALAPLLERAVVRFESRSTLKMLPLPLLSCKLPDQTLCTKDLHPDLKCLYLSRILDVSESTLHPHYVAKFPRTLTHLMIDAIGKATTGFFIAELPRTLKKLTLWIDVGIHRQWEAHNQKANSSFWPPHLETFIYQNSVSASELDALPTTLKRLLIGLSLEETIDASKFPPLLTSLTLEVPQKVLFEGNFPALITDLNIDSSIGFAAMNGNLHNLTSLKHFACYSPLEAELFLPSTSLTSISLDSCPTESFGLLPRTLLTFAITQALSASLAPAIEKGELFIDLPPSITDLAINRSYSASRNPINCFPSQRLSSVLPHLRRMILTSMHMFESRFIREMPQSLRELSVAIGDLTYEDAAFLPQYLRDCTIQRSIISEEVLADYWPPFALTPHVGLPETQLKIIRRRSALCNCY